MAISKIRFRLCVTFELRVKGDSSLDLRQLPHPNGEAG